MYSANFHTPKPNEYLYNLTESAYIYFVAFAIKYFKIQLELRVGRFLLYLDILFVMFVLKIGRSFRNGVLSVNRVQKHANYRKI